ncbi:MAG: ice-binding family protein [Xanthobacteraceae bacterium]
MKIGDAAFNGIFLILSLAFVFFPSPLHAQGPSLGTAASFGVLAGSTVTNTGSSVIQGNVGVWPGNAVIGFPPGIIVPPFTIHAGDAVAQQAQVDNTTAFNTLAGLPAQFNLTGQNLGGMSLGPAVYSFATSAQLTGVLTLNGQGNPNAVFVFQIGSTLTTASNSAILLINGAQGANVFFQVGSSSTLGTNSVFTGNIVALTSITLDTGATLTCGRALAQNGAVTLDSNTITICSAASATAADVLALIATTNQLSVAGALDAFVANGGTLPLAFQNLFFFLTPAQLAEAFTQLSGEAATGTAPTGTQAMNSFLSLLTNPFDSNRPFTDNRNDSPMVVKTLGYAPERALLPGARSVFAPFAVAPDPRRWGVWGATYGGQGSAAGDPLTTGTHDRSMRSFGYATGFDYRVTPDTIAGFALGGGNTHYGLSDGLGGGRSDMLQAGVYSSIRINAAYVSLAAAYAWHRVSTDRYVTVAGTDHLTADFSANNFGGRIEAGYRFLLPGVAGVPGWYGVTPYAAGQLQTFRTPSYSENAVSGSSIFALVYDARTTNTFRSELGAWFDWGTAMYDGAILSLRSRAAWAHDQWSDPTLTASFQALPGSSFIVTGATPATDLLLASAGAEVYFKNGFSVAAWLNGEFSEQGPKYAGTGRVRYTW